jgi:hypothetical protein
MAEEVMSETPTPYEISTYWPRNVSVKPAMMQSDLDAMLSEVRRGLLQVIRAIEKYQATRLEKDLRLDEDS